MNPILQNKINELQNANEYECWYLVKQPTAFDSLCYLVSFLKDYKINPPQNSSMPLQDYISNRIQNLNAIKPNIKISDNYRALRVAAFFGLIQMVDTNYVNAVITDTFEEITQKCSGNYEQINLYKNVVQRQIEKMFISSSVDEEYQGVRKDYRLYPVMLLYKVLLEMGRSTGNYSVSMTDYRYIIATTKKFEDFLETLLLIKLLHEDTTATVQFDTFRTKFDNRLIQALKQLPTITVDKNSISLNSNAISEVAQKVFIFESNPNIFTTDNYLSFLGSTKALLDLSDNSYTIGDFKILTPEWFKNKAKEFTSDDSDAASMYIDFNSKFGIKTLSSLSGEDLLKTLFLGASSDNLCHELEYVTRNIELFGSIKGGSAFKYPMYFDKDSSMWTSGTKANPKQLTLDEAIILGTAVRDGLVKAVNIIQKAQPIESIEDYLSLYTNLYSAIPDYIDSIWITKYFHMLFPKIFPVFYNKPWQTRILNALQITPNDTAYGRLGQINDFVKECDITNVVFARIFHKYCLNIDLDEVEDTSTDEIVTERKQGGTNIILYGVPGAGKSWTIKHEYCDDESRMERLVFHPDYTYSDFVGQILPKVSDDGSVSYEFSAGPFTKLVRKAYLNPDKMYFLVIEEVNRGNAPAIFGDVFQLLDRDKDGKSEYEITNADIAKIVYKNENHKVSIPSNMSILCTMNTSDQNVFTLDTAFQRRWSMQLIRNRFREDESEKNLAKTIILDTNVTWEKFFTEINNFILGKNIRMTSAEDKRLGTHFVSVDDLSIGDGSERQISKFPEKVLKYLWDDAFKFTKEDVFDLEKVKSLEDVIDLFVKAKGNERFKIFKENIYNTLVPATNKLESW